MCTYPNNHSLRPGLRRTSTREMAHNGDFHSPIKAPRSSIQAHVDLRTQQIEALKQVKKAFNRSLAQKAAEKIAEDQLKQREDRAEERAR